MDFRDVYNNKPYSKRVTNPLELKYKYDNKMTEVNNRFNYFIKIKFNYSFMEKLKEIVLLFLEKTMKDMVKE